MGRLQKDFTTKVSLAVLAEGYGELWKQAYVEVAPLTIKALPALRKMNITGGKGVEGLEDLADEDVAKVTTMLQSAFIGGKVVLGGELVEAEAADLEDLPMEALNDIISAATGKLDPKS